ncbi:MAG: Crp/Fnr family transcriptional regulator [Flavobacterium nitrogenifigens]|uniref:cAMP-binding domain of CRP or a regulatory subunit of cAMP-dependent protein kinases n=1 Tax=Flavobacterium nitrogenifigens TaxID=1617283 RepID=A0A521CG10_9FLAO|nr:Crp/Fnr family transcriptional regulator [Flavobacterium nitrogenifigens]KAF2327133.1 Crp/Fnr family transcriptional regulator [Flavobacterium nitrogenifigens]MDQ8011502.1 Crp/Fnr family transcriptional regulator [Flavobacterium nitrogenifigens]SMO57700.1 cAMP-binding domain of CRP or a regulatory subunit of cAMP-dependent protein kinases [Flavobacterium nitrogenifigens]
MKSTYSLLQKQILAIASFSENEMEAITSCFKYEKFNAKEYLSSMGKTSNKIFFIVEGLARVYYLKDGKEITTYLSCDEGFIASYSSFINQSVSFENIQCIEDCEVLSITFEKMQFLYNEIPNWERVGRILAEQNYLCMADRVLKLQMIPAKEKYQTFLSSAPAKIMQRTPLIYIASFLGITPESLSRIRQDIS